MPDNIDNLTDHQLILELARRMKLNLRDHEHENVKMHQAILLSAILTTMFMGKPNAYEDGKAVIVAVYTSDGAETLMLEGDEVPLLRIIASIGHDMVYIGMINS